MIYYNLLKIKTHKKKNLMENFMRELNFIYNKIKMYKMKMNNCK